jgi:hypothetical protein
LYRETDDVAATGTSVTEEGREEGTGDGTVDQAEGGKRGEDVELEKW